MLGLIMIECTYHNLGTVQNCPNKSSAQLESQRLQSFPNLTVKKKIMIQFGGLSVMTLYGFLTK